MTSERGFNCCDVPVPVVQRIFLWKSTRHIVQYLSLSILNSGDECRMFFECHTSIVPGTGTYLRRFTFVDTARPPSIMYHT
jgi:hypothetical protein